MSIMRVSLIKISIFFALSTLLLSCEKDNRIGDMNKGNIVSVVENGELFRVQDILFTVPSSDTTVTMTFFVTGYDDDEYTGQDISYYIECKRKWMRIVPESSWPYERASFRLPIKDRYGNVIKEVVEGDLVTISFIIEQNKSCRKRESVFHLISPTRTIDNERILRIVQEGR